LDYHFNFSFDWFIELKGALIMSNYQHIILGLGKTGLSTARFLSKQGINCMICDHQSNPPKLASLKAELPKVPVQCGAFNADLLSRAQVLYVSPGISLNNPAIMQAKQNGVKISGDIDLLSKYAKAPIVAITGTNGKSTVTTLVGKMAQQAGKKVAIGGNLGTPILDLLANDIELYVVEVSSFQLDTCANLGAEAAACLNIADDHQDRYPNFAAYVSSKQKIANGAKTLIINNELTNFAPLNTPVITFGFDEGASFYLKKQNGALYLAHQEQNLIAVQDLKIKGGHNWLNALAALALGTKAGLDMPSMLTALRNFKGLEHRCEWLANIKGVDYYNDSKATNVAASIAAISGIGSNIKGKIILLAGGLGKDANFAPLADCAAKYCRQVLLFGADAKIIAKQLKNVAYKIVDDLPQATKLAAQIAMPNDAVLLAPACASMDQFTNFEQRGDVFAKEVANLC